MAVLIRILQLAWFRFTPECCFKTSAKPLMFNKSINFCLKRPLTWSCWGIGLWVPAARFCGGLLPTSLALADCSAARRHKHINHLAGLWSRLLLPIPELYSISSNCAWRSLIMIRIEKQTSSQSMVSVASFLRDWVMEISCTVVFILDLKNLNYGGDIIRM